MKEGNVTEQMRSALNKMVRTEEALEKKKVYLTFSRKSSEQWTMVEVTLASTESAAQALEVILIIFGGIAWKNQFIFDKSNLQLP